MKKNEIQLQYKKKIKLLTDYNKNYFDKNNPIVDDSVYDKLKNEGVLTNVHYRPIYVNSYYVKKYGRLFLKGCETFYKQVLALPLHPELQQEDVDFISSKVEKVCNDCF